MKNNGSLIDSSLKEVIVGQLGNKEAEPVLKAMETFMLQNNVVDAPALMGDGRTKGDWRINLTMPDGHKQDIRPDSSLSYIIIKEMLKSGPIRFALEMKRAQMVSVFRNRRSVSAYCKNEELQHVTEFVIEHILPFAAFEFTWSALVYGAAFMEQVWENKTLSQLGLDGSKYYTIPKQLNLVPHETIRHINRDNQGNFDGFVQMADYKLGAYYIMSTPSTGVNPGDVDVKVMDSLVIPYQGFSRNLWGESFLYPLYPLWFWYEIVIRSLVSYSELMGDPPRLGKAPSRKKVRLSPDSADLVDAIDYLLALAVNLKRSNAVVIPSDYDEQGHPEWELGYLQTPDRSQPFVQIIELFNSMILRAALTGDRTYSQVQGQGVPSAIGQIGAEATSLHNEMVVSSWLHYLNRYWISNISKYNLGQDGVPVWLEVQGLDPKERDFLMAISGIAGNSATFQEFFYMVDWESLGKMSGLPMLSKEEAQKLKEEISKHDQEQQVQQIQTQNQLNIESTVQKAQVEKEMGIGEFAAPPPEEKPTNLEIQLELEKLTSGQVPIFFSQEEIRNLFGKKASSEQSRRETATPQNFFIPSPQSKDLATALALAYKYQTIQLFNPAHDAIGRFASKAGSAVSSGIEKVKDKSGYNKLSTANQKRVKLLAVVAGMAAVSVVAVGATGSQVRRSTKATTATINGVEFTHYGTKSVDIEKLAQTAFNQSKEVGNFMGSAPKLSKMVFADDFHMENLANSKVVHSSSFKEVFEGTAKLGYESKLEELANSSGMFKTSDVKLGAAYLYSQLNPSGIGGFTVPNSGRIYIKTDTDKNQAGSITHELIHNVKQKYNFWHGKGNGGLAIYEGATEGIAKHILGSNKRATAYDDTVDILSKLAKTRGQEPAKFFKDLLLNPESFNINLDNDIDLSGIQLTDEGILLAVIQGQYDLVEDEFIDLIDRHKDDIKLETIQLFNPLHDTLGRFASKVGGGIKRGAKAVGKFAKENEAELLTVGILAAGAAAGGIAHHQFRKGLPDKAEYKANYDNQTSLAQKILATPAEYISRKGSYGSLIARSALGAGGLTSSFATESTGGKVLAAVLPYTLAPSTFVSIAAGGAIYAKGSLLGAAATAAFSLAVFGAAAPAAATLIGGVVVGSAATIIAYQLVDHAGKKFTNGYIKRYAPKDPYHITVTEDDETKRRTFTKFSMDNLGILSLYSFANLATTLLEEENDNLMASVMPMVAMLVFDDRVKRISSPFEIPGFTHGGNEWFLTKDLAPNFIKLWAGDSTELENVQLFNPAHDNLGRFASKSGGGFSLLGGSLDPKRTPKPLQAQRSANKVMQGMGQKFKSGLVKGVKVEACADWDCMKSKTGISANALGAYHKGKVVLSPHGLAYSAYDNPKFFNRIVAHEATHARKRSGGGGIEFFSKNQVDLEEGATELISMGHTKYPYGKSPYIKQMRSVAAAARRGSGGNQARAWQLVSLMHYYNDTDRGLAAYRAYANSDKFNKGSDADVEWLMGSMPTQLELDEDEKQFAASEKEIYKSLRKVQKQTFPEPKAFAESELQ